MSVAARLAVFQFIVLGGTGAEEIISYDDMRFTRVIHSPRQSASTCIGSANARVSLLASATASVVNESSASGRIALKATHNARVRFR